MEFLIQNKILIFSGMWSVVALGVFNTCLGPAEFKAGFYHSTLVFAILVLISVIKLQMLFMFLMQ